MTSTPNNTNLATAARDVFFADKPSLPGHVELIMNREAEYLSELQTICDKGVISTLSQPAKACALAALQMTWHNSHIATFLQHCDVVAIVKACQILDRPRLIKQLEQKIAAIEQAHPHLVAEKESSEKEEADTKGKKRGSKGRKRTSTAKSDDTAEEAMKKKRKRRIDVLRLQLKNAKALLQQTLGTQQQSSVVKEVICSASLSGAFAKKVRQWASSLKADFLEFIVMSGSMNMWKELADMVHFAPKDFALSYFLSAAHGGALPEDSFVQGMRSLVEAPVEQLAERFRTLAQEHPQVYQAFNFIRMHDRVLKNKDIAKLLATNVPVSTAIWYLEEIAQSNSSVPRIVADRLKTENWMDESSKVSESFGKLLERILTFKSRGWSDAARSLKPAAERRLGALKEKWAVSTEESREEGLTVIFGDKSASMQSAIEAATIIAAMVSTCFQGELSFFDEHSVASPHKRPDTVEHVLEIVRKIRADNCTSMAAALWPYYQAKQKISRIILVSDEGENTSCHGYRFAKLLKKYMNEVHSGVELVSICVDSGCYSFRNSFQQEQINCKRIEIDGRRPDLSKFDLLLGQIALLSQSSKETGEEKLAGHAEGQDFVVVES